MLERIRIVLAMKVWEDYRMKNGGHEDEQVIFSQITEIWQLMYTCGGNA